VKSISKLKDEARRCEQQEQWDKAIVAYLQVLKMSEAGEAELDLPLYNRVGDLYIRLGRPDDAVKYYEQAAERYAELGLFNNAMALCNKALRFRPERLAIVRMLARYSLQQGFLTDAMQYYVSFAEKHFSRGEHEEGLAALEEFASTSNDPDARELLGRRLQGLGRTESAVKELRAAYDQRVAAGQLAAAETLLGEIRGLDPAAAANNESPQAGPVAAEAWADAADEAADPASGVREADAAAPAAPAEDLLVQEPVAETEDEMAGWSGGAIDGFESTAYGAVDDYAADPSDRVETTEMPIEDPGVSPLEGLESTMFDSHDAMGYGIDGAGVDVEQDDRTFDHAGYAAGAEAFAADIEGAELHGWKEAEEEGDIGEPLPLLSDDIDAFMRAEAEPPLEAADFDTTSEAETEAQPVADFAGDITLAQDGRVAEDASSAVEAVDAGAEQAAAAAAEQELAGGYIDLAELLSISSEETTRFRIEEMDLTGDAERNFAQVLEQFRAKLLAHLPPDDVAAHYDLGIAFREMGLLDEAIMVFQIAARAGHMRLKIFEELGQCFLEKQQYTIAEKVLRRALSLERDDELELLGVYYHLGRACEELGQLDDARDAYERVLAMDINFKDATDRLARL
jgi:tetratricopeptide (TPR) repeat protein